MASRSPFRHLICLSGHVGGELACGCGAEPGEQHVIALGGGHEHERGYQGQPVGWLAGGVRAWRDEAGLVGEDDRLGPVSEGELGEDAGDVGLHGGFAEGQRAS